MTEIDVATHNTSWISGFGWGRAYGANKQPPHPRQPYGRTHYLPIFVLVLVLDSSTTTKSQRIMMMCQCTTIVPKQFVAEGQEL
jgi:hypothetical protein